MHSTIDSRMLNIAQEAALHGIGAMSLGEALTAALVLNRCDWLHERGYSIAEALDRIGPEWTARLREIERQFYDEVTQARLRFNFEICSHPTDTGCFTLRLLEGSKEVGGGKFSTHGRATQFTDEQSAYDEALATGRSWLVAKQAAVSPELSR
ncbi:hypothetical protein VRY85_07465 [Achromobacter sp. F4_2707]|uniref:hypothetical protein n=1 Tax=Achromobacter sp. F4_2707 TaxID=3114286 RepID=UPI0039C650CC